jgi:polysaccharide chain length determinant protein (PEP-CTERM system associated)
MNDILGPLLAQLNAMWQRRWAGVLAAWAVATLAGLVIVRVPERWEANARVFVDTQTVLKPLMNGLAVQPDMDQMVGILARTLITRPNLEKLVDSANLAPEGQSPEARDRLVEELFTTIRIAPAGDKNLFLVSYRDTDPQRARRVVQNLVTLFISSTAGGKRRDSEEAREFVDEQIAGYEKKLEEAENRRKEFKLRNFSYGGLNNQTHFERMASLSDALNNAQLELHAALQSRDALKRQVEGEDPTLPTGATPGGAISATPELDARLDVLHKQLDDLLRRFTDNHPDVVQTQRLIAQIEEQKKREAETRPAGHSGTGGAINPAATNPVYQQLRVSLAGSEANVASLQARTKDLQSELDRLRAEAKQVPEIEAEMAKLDRDYDVIRHNYEQLAQRREAATIAEDIDVNAKLAVFRVIDPPRVLPTPVFPSRLVLVPLGLLVALGAGAFACFGLTQTFPRVQEARDLRLITERPLLASISLLSSEAGVRKARLWNIAFAASVAVLIAGYGSWAAWLLTRPGMA